MKIRFGVVRFTGFAVLAFFLWHSAAADEFQVTGQTNVSVCTALSANCGTVSFTLDLQTQQALHIPYGNVYDITSMTGTLDGLYSISGSGGWLLPVQGNSQNPIPYGPILYTLNGQQGEITFDDLIAGCSFMTLLPGNAGSAFITWNATSVSAAEPSSLVLLLAGFLAGLLAFSCKRLC